MDVGVVQQVGTAKPAMPARRAPGRQIAFIRPVSNGRRMNAQNIGGLTQADPL